MDRGARMKGRIERWRGKESAGCVSSHSQGSVRGFSPGLKLRSAERADGLECRVG